MPGNGPGYDKHRSKDVREKASEIRSSHEVL